MNNQEAKFILRAYRPSGGDAHDGAFGDALEQARRDPELGAWFAREQAFDRAVAAKLRAVTAPASLRDAILAGARVSEPQRTVWRQPAWVALAASVALLLGATFWAFRLNRGVSMERMAELAVAELDSPRHGSGMPSSRELSSRLADPGMRLAGGLPFGFEQLQAMGCRTVRLSRRNALETCFRRNGVEFHLYVMERETSVRPGTGPAFFEQKGLSTMAWTDAKYVYVVTSSTGVDQLKGLL